MTAVRRFSLVRGDWKLSQLRRKSELYLYLSSIQNCFSHMVDQLTFGSGGFEE
jgi:hypothetical protein